MKQSLFIKNIPIDEKRIGFIETVVTRLARRSRKVTKAIISPVPIMAAAIGEDLSGIIMKSVLFKGRIIKVFIHLKEKPKNPVKIDVVIGKSGISYRLEKVNELIDVDIPTNDGDILAVYLTSSEEDKVIEILASILWMPDKADIEVRKHLIDELEKDANVYLEKDQKMIE